MAFSDYKLCEVCESKTFYDADLTIKDPYDERGLYVNCGDVKSLCVDCAKKFELKVILIETHKEGT